MLTLLLIGLPFVAGFLLLGIKNATLVKRLAFSTSLASVVLTVCCLIAYKTGQTVLEVNYLWIPSLGIHFHLGIDGISMVMVILSTLLMPFIILAGKKNQEKAHVLYPLMLFMQGAMIGVFTSLDCFLFYIFWELSLIPIYFIILIWGGHNRKRITLKFFIYTLSGSLLMLLAFISLYLLSPNHTFDITGIYGLNLPADVQSWLFWFIFIAFAIKMPIFPLHTWQPSTYTAAPAQGTMLLSGIMLKMGIYGVIRWLLPVVPVGVALWGNVAMILAIIGVLYGSIIALKQNDLKTLVAYSSIAHVGLIAAGLFAGNFQSLQGVMFQMLVHGINVVGLFYLIDIIETRTGTRKISELGGIRSLSPKFTSLFMIIMLGSIALPLTNGFIGEFLLISGIFSYNIWMAFAAGLTIIMGAIYMLYMFQRVMLGTPSSASLKFQDVSGVELIGLSILAILVIALGVYPQPLLDLTSDAVNSLFSFIVY
ncbi:MAG: NADH-quinone oxidoreductase subunit M [Bacteroidota bacterium]|nr:NADH-quinone oxidoreductase subunit M [Bacteroidota bacterium]